MIIDGGNDDDVSELLALTRENNKLLRGLYKSMVLSRTLSTIYWFVIIGSMVGAYYYLQPVVTKYFNTYETLMNMVGKIENGGNVVSGGIQKWVGQP